MVFFHYRLIFDYSFIDQTLMIRVSSISQRLLLVRSVDISISGSSFRRSFAYVFIISSSQLINNLHQETRILFQNVEQAILHILYASYIWLFSLNSETPFKFKRKEQKERRKQSPDFYTRKLPFDILTEPKKKCKLVVLYATHIYHLFTMIA